jgi:hypothetical protein
MTSRGHRNGESDLIAHIDAGFSAVVSAVERVSERVDALGDRVDKMNVDLGGRIDNVAFGAMGKAVRRHDAEIEALKSRVKRPERKRA